MVILRTRNKITDFLMILAWASPFKAKYNLSHHGSQTAGNIVMYDREPIIKIASLLICIHPV